MQENGYMQRMGISPAPSIGWNGTAGVAVSPVVKKVVRLDVPADKFPNVCKSILVWRMIKFCFWNDILFIIDYV